MFKYLAIHLGKIIKIAKARDFGGTLFFSPWQQLLIHQEAGAIVTDFWLIFTPLCLSLFYANTFSIQKKKKKNLAGSLKDTIPGWIICILDLNPVPQHHYPWK